MKLLRYVLLFLITLSTISTPQKKKFTVEEIFTNRSLYGRSLSQVKWFDGGEKFSFIKMDTESKSMALFEHDVMSGTETKIVSGSELKFEETDKPFMISNYEWLPDNKHILFTGVLPARKIKSGGAFYLYNRETKEFSILADSEEEQININFSPDGKKAAFVRGNNIFAIDVETKVEMQLTFDGSDVILNGHFDWVYEEEFHIINAIEWSPDNKRIAFWRLDQSNVPEIKIAKWDSLYLNELTMRYPKAGATNSLVKIGVADIQTKKVNWMDIGKETDIYIPRIKFTNNPEVLSIQRLNRLQNTLDLLFADVKTGKSTTMLTDTDPCWLDISDDLYFLKKKEEFVWTSERDGYKHIYIYDKSGKLVRQLTSGKWEIDAVTGVDEENDLVYFTSNKAGVQYLNFYSVSLSGGEVNKISKLDGHHTITLSPDKKYFIDRYSTASSLTATTIYNTTGEIVRELIPSDMTMFGDYELSPAEFISFNTSDGIKLNASIIKPFDFDESKKYPVLIYNYSGPGSQSVTDRWSGPTGLWHQMLAQHGYIIVVVDVRGTGGRGKEFKNLMYKKLGHWEVNDHVEAVNYLSTLTYVDPERIGIWGWSYGGYVSALALMKAADVFKAAISVAPVIHWKFYDSIYTERFMSLPHLNPEGYENSAVLNYTDKLKGKLLLVHGTSDDNVHFQNAVKLVEKLIAENKQFETMYYPEKDHGISGGMTRVHLFNMMTNFILNNL